MKKIFIILLICAFTQVVISQEKEDIPTRFTQNGFVSLDYISVKMPNDEFNNPEVNMGLTGIHYNLWLNKSVYGGVGFYGSIHGKRGGLFTLGVDLGIKKSLSKNLFFDTGFHFGGGGGAGAPDGGGAFLLPHINLGYQFKKFSTTLGYSYINFFDKGNISSSQFRIGIQIPVSVDYLDFKEKEKNYSIKILSQSPWNQTVSKNSFLIQLNNYQLQEGTIDTKGIIYPDGTTIRVAGFEFAGYFKNNWLWFFKASGAFHGIDAGYMDIFIGGGYKFEFNRNRTNIQSKLAIGAGGGGGLETKGGLLIQPEISIEQKLFNSTFLYLNLGKISTPDSFYKSTSYGLGIKQYFNSQGIKDYNNQAYSKTKIKGLEFMIGNEFYTNAQRKLYPTQELHQIALQVNLHVSNNIYFAGSTSFASFGNAGAYAEGIVGLGYQSKSYFKDKIQVYTQILTGAAGGGHISTGQGLIIKPSVGFNFKLNNKLYIRSSIGKVKAIKGELNSTSFTFGLNYRLSFLTAN